MLPIEALSYRLEDLLKAAMPEHADRIHLNRTLAFSADEVPAINITQGADTPNNDVSDFQRSGWTASFDIQIVCSGSSERAIVSELNSFRLNIYRALIANPRLGFDWVLQLAPGAVSAPLTDSSSTIILKQITANWQVLYTADRDDPSVELD